MRVLTQSQALQNPCNIRRLRNITYNFIDSYPEFRSSKSPILDNQRVNPSSAVHPDGEKTFRGERFFVRARFIGKRYRAGHVVPNTLYAGEGFL
ncbi:MAG: hypothetical protein LBM04_08460 [Opitutaceae bacterium]|jgi:hypothetical protein|nr:hypothetical protein [Opitutaceae bacterium]